MTTSYRYGANVPTQSLLRGVTHLVSARPRRGAVVPLVALLLVILLGMVALTVDIGFIALADTELQRTADASAVAAVVQLPSQSAATSAAQWVVSNNHASADPTFALTDIEYGFWDRHTATFNLGAGVNAARVTLERTEDRGNPLALFFAAVMGSGKADVSATAIAMYDNNMCGPLVGIDWVLVPGDPSTDSYRSSLGDYADQLPRDNGSLCSDGPIDLEGNPIINGDANPGKAFTTTLEGASIVTGNTSPRLRPLNITSPDISYYETNNDNASLPLVPKGKKNWVSPISPQGDFLIDGGKTYDMPGGTYYFNDLTLTGNSTLRVTGPTTIYMTGNLDTAGGYLINTTENANNLQFVITGSQAIVTSKVDLYAVVFAPDAEVEIRGSTAYYGAALGKTLVCTGTGDVHYDEDLQLADGVNLPKRIALVQ